MDQCAHRKRREYTVFLMRLPLKPAYVVVLKLTNALPQQELKIMDTKARLEQLEVNVAGLYDMLAGATQVTAYIHQNILTEDQRNALVEWLATRASESDAPGRVYFAQLGAHISDQERFIELMHIAGQEFMDDKEKAIRGGRPIL